MAMSKLGLGGSGGGSGSGGSHASADPQDKIVRAISPLSAMQYIWLIRVMIGGIGHGSSWQALRQEERRRQRRRRGCRESSCESRRSVLHPCVRF